MKITILGTRGEIECSLRYHSKHSGILIDDELLIDVGEKSFLKHNPRWILISHLHPDHAYFIRRGKEEIPELSVPIYAPETPKKYLKLLNKTKKIGPYTVIPIPTHHSKNVVSHGYLVKKGNDSFLYTSDLVWIDKKFHEVIDRPKLVITEASFLRKGGMVKKDTDSGKLFGHQGIPNLISLLKGFSKNILFMHFGSWFYKNPKESRKKILELAKEHQVNAIIGYDGLTVNLNDLTQ